MPSPTPSPTHDHLYVRDIDHDDERRCLHVSRQDRAAFDALPDGEGGLTDEVVVLDRATGTRWVVRRGDCSAACYCAADAFVLET